MPGEEIIFTLKINNQSTKKVNHLHIDLLQKIRFFANCGHSILCQVKVAALQFPNPVNPKSIESFEGRLVVPSVSTSSSSLCRIINVFYELIFTFGASGLSTNEHLAIPIIIGSIPLKSA